MEHNRLRIQVPITHHCVFIEGSIIQMKLHVFTLGELIFGWNGAGGWVSGTAPLLSTRLRRGIREEEVESKRGKYQDYDGGSKLVVPQIEEEILILVPCVTTRFRLNLFRFLISVIPLPYYRSLFFTVRDTHILNEPVAPWPRVLEGATGIKKYLLHTNFGVLLGVLLQVQWECLKILHRMQATEYLPSLNSKCGVYRRVKVSGMCQMKKTVPSKRKNINKK